MKYTPDVGGGYDYTENWRKPTTLYALASGIYPIIDGGSKYSIRGPGVQYHYSSQHTGVVGKSPIAWYEGKSPVRPFIQGNYVFQSYKSNPREFPMPSPFLQKYKTSLIQDVASKGKSAVEQMNRDMATAMNVQVKKSYRVRGVPPSGIASLEEARGRGSFKLGAGEASKVYGEGVGRPQQYDFYDESTGKAINVTKSSLTSTGHGMYGTGLSFVKNRWDAINKALKAKHINELEADQLKINAGVEYFKQRLPEWNAHIRKAKTDVGFGNRSIRQSQARSRQLRAQLHLNAKTGGSFPSHMYQGMRNQFYESTGFMTMGAMSMTKQLFANRDLFFTGKGAFESYKIRPFVQGEIGAFKGWASGPRVFEYKDINKLDGTVHYGYGRTLDHGMTVAEQTTIESGIKSDMASFLQSEHKGSNMNLGNDQLRTIASSNIGTKTREIRPTVNLVQAGREFNRGINELIKDVSWDGSEGKGRPPPIVRDIIKRNRFRLTYSESSPTTVWAAPYISVFDSKSLLTG